MDFILLPPYFSLCSSQDIFHSGAIELGQILIEHSVPNEPLSESVDCCLLITEWDGDLLPVEASDVISE